MAALRLILLHAVLTAASFAAVEIRFVPAFPDGAVSLGIYDTEGRLVRVLCEEWPFDRFAVGLNGLSTSWDGKDAAGHPVSAGSYRARGYVVGSVEVEGEAIWFNDWMGEVDAPAIEAIAAVGVLPGGDLLLAARLTGDRGALLRCALYDEIRWQVLATEPLVERSGPVRLALASDRVYLLFSGCLRAIDLQSGKEMSVVPPAESPRDVSVWGDRVAVLDRDTVKIFSVADAALHKEFAAPQPGAKAIALLSDGSIAAAGADGSLWRHDGDWSRIDLADGVKVRLLAPGLEGTFWVAEESVGGLVAVAQYSPHEGRLAEWPSAGASEALVSLAASAESDSFAAVLDSPGHNRTVAIRRQTVGGSWEWAADKTITDSASFGWTSAGLSPDTGQRPETIAVRLAENPLDPAAPRTLVLRATADEAGTGLTTADGLPLIRVSEEAGFFRVMVRPGTTSGEVRFYQGDGARVEEYLLTGLGAVASFDAGTIEMEGGAEKPAPPTDAEETAAIP